MPWRVSKALYVSACIYLSRRMVWRYILHVNRKKKLENDGFEVHLIKKNRLFYILKRQKLMIWKIIPSNRLTRFFLGCNHWIEYHLLSLTLYIINMRFGTEILQFFAQYLFNQYTNFIWIYNLSADNSFDTYRSEQDVFVKRPN